MIEGLSVKALIVLEVLDLSSEYERRLRTVALFSFDAYCYFAFSDTFGRISGLISLRAIELMAVLALSEAHEEKYAKAVSFLREFRGMFIELKNRQSGFQ